METHSVTSMKPLWRQLAWWSLACPFVMVVALIRHDLYLLNVDPRTVRSTMDRW